MNRLHASNDQRGQQSTQAPEVDFIIYEAMLVMSKEAHTLSSCMSIQWMIKLHSYVSEQSATAKMCLVARLQPFKKT